MNYWKSIEQQLNQQAMFTSAEHAALRQVKEEIKSGKRESGERLEQRRWEFLLYLIARGIIKLDSGPAEL